MPPLLSESVGVASPPTRNELREPDLQLKRFSHAEETVIAAVGGAHDSGRDRIGEDVSRRQRLLRVYPHHKVRHGIARGVDTDERRLSRARIPHAVRRGRGACKGQRNPGGRCQRPQVDLVLEQRIDSFGGGVEAGDDVPRGGAEGSAGRRFGMVYGCVDIEVTAAAAIEPIGAYSSDEDVRAIPPIKLSLPRPPLSLSLSSPPSIVSLPFPLDRTSSPDCPAI